MRDLRYGVRLLVRRPGLSVTVVLAIMVGFGATSTVLSLLVGVLFNPLPIPEPDRVATFSRSAEGAPEGWGVVGLPDMLEWRGRSQTFQDIAGWTTSSATWTREGDPEIVRLALVTEGFDRVLGSGLAKGRFFSSDEFVDGLDRVVVLTDALWSSRFGRDPEVVGTGVILEGVSHRIVGVLEPQALAYPNAEVGFWKPLAPPLDSWQRTVRGASWMNAVGRMREGVSLDAAQSELTRIQTRVVVEYPRENRGQDRVTLTPLKEKLVGPVRSMLWITFATGGLVLLIATGNISILLLSRSSRRVEEFRLRLALGGHRSGLIRQLLVESGVLVGVGAVLGTLVAPTMIRGLLYLYPDDLPRQAELGVGGAAFLAVLGLSVCVTLFVTLVSALAVRRAGTLYSKSMEGAGHAQSWLRAGLATGQVAMTVVLVFGSVLFIRTLSALENQELGFDATDVVSFRVTFPEARYPLPTDVERFLETLRTEATASPEFESVGAVSSLPFSGSEWGSEFRIADRGERLETSAFLRIATPGYVEALRIPVLVGRDFHDSDRSESARVALVNRTVAGILGGEQSAVGRMIEVEGEVREVVGVVENARYRGLGETQSASVYLPLSQLPRQSMFVALRVRATDPIAVVPTLRTLLRQLDDELAISGLSTMEQRVRDSVGDERFRAYLVSVLGALALLLAIIGIYGVMSHSVTQRSREIGVRLALGEPPGGVLRRILVRTTRIGLMGVVTGTLVAVLGLRSLERLIFGIDLYDWRVLLAVPLGLLVLTGVSGLPAALRASRLDPVRTLSDT